jgi:hypothetical protein
VVELLVVLAIIGSDLDDVLGQMLQTPRAVFTCPSQRAAQAYLHQWVRFNAASTDVAAKSDYGCQFPRHQQFPLWQKRLEI